MSRATILHWEPSAYLSDYKTQRLSLEEHGAYCVLLWHMWNDSESQYEFPLDYHALASIWKCPVDDATRLLDSLINGTMSIVKVKETRAGSVLQSKRLQKQAEQARIYRDKQAEKGRRSGAVRRANTTNSGSTDVEQRFAGGSTTNEPHVARNHVARKHVSASPDAPAAEKPDVKVGPPDASLPACLSSPIEVIDPPYTGTCFGYINDRCEQQFGTLLSHSDLAELKAAITEGCIPGCKGEHPIDCALVIANKLATKGKTSFRTSRLWLKCVREDRMEARR